MKVRPLVILATFLSTLLVLPIAPSLADSAPKSNDRIIDGKSNSHDSHKGVYSPTRKQNESPEATTTSGSNAPGTSIAAGRGAVTYHVDGVIVAKPHVYVIWYGNWEKGSCSAEDSQRSTPSILMNLVKNIGDSAWNGINATYYQRVNGKQVFVSSGIEYSGCVVDPGSVGLSLDSDPGSMVADVVDSELTQGKLKTDANGIYLVITAINVSVNGFITYFCGYHDYYSLPTVDIKYALIGDPTVSMGGCASQIAVSPNGNPAADAMASVLAHELIEPISDPLLNAWYDELGYENADKCAWRYGLVTKAADGSYSNMKIGDRLYLIQQNVAANSNLCVSFVRNGERSSNSNGSNG
jgi:hypothetical protein